MKRKVLIGIIIILVIFCLGSGIYISNYYHSNHTLEEYSKLPSLNLEEKEDFLIVKGEEPNGIGIIFYPGGKVEYTAYLPLMENLVQEGYTCFLQKMPANLAVFGVNKADNILEQVDEIDRWYIAGHSLGGAMASSYAVENQEVLEGIILLGAYPAKDLSNTDLKLLSIVGSEDGVVNQEKLEENKSYAPNEAVYKVIEGGNHAYFGDYGEQKGDGSAKIYPEDQWEETAMLIKDFAK